MDTGVLSQRGNSKFSKSGYQYVMDKKSMDGTIQYWRCERKRECKARIHVAKGEIIKFINVHSHEPSASKIEADVVINAIKRRAKETAEGTSQIITGCMTNLSEACQGCLPTRNALRKLVKRQRNQVCSTPDISNYLELLLNPENDKMGEARPIKEETVLLSETGSGTEQIYSSDNKLSTLSDSSSGVLAKSRVDEKRILLAESPSASPHPSCPRKMVEVNTHESMNTREETDSTFEQAEGMYNQTLAITDFVSQSVHSVPSFQNKTPICTISAVNSLQPGVGDGDSSQSLYDTNNGLGQKQHDTTNSEDRLVKAMNEHAAVLVEANNAMRSRAYHFCNSLVERVESLPHYLQDDFELETLTLLRKLKQEASLRMSS